MQNREGIAPELAEDRRFFAMLGSGKTNTPAGWNDPGSWKELDEIPEDRTFGFALCGAGSTYAAIDYDHVIDDDGAVYPPAREVLDRINRIGKTYTEVSQSGRGLHQILDLGDFADNFDPVSNGEGQTILWMDSGKYRSLPKEEKVRIPKVELFYQTGGRYFLLTGKHSDIAENHRVAKGEAAAAIWSEVLRIREENRQKYVGPTTISTAATQRQVSEETMAEVMDALQWISADDRETWVRVGQALQHIGAAFEIWDEWSRWKDQRAGILCDKYDERETPRIWESFRRTGSQYNEGTIFKLAKASGWRDVQKASVSLDTPALRQVLDLKNDGSVRGSFGNYCRIMELDEYLKGKIFFNELDGRVMLAGFSWYIDQHPVRDVDLDHLRRYISDKYDLDDERKIRRAFEISADQNRIHPIRDELNALQWDGLPRLGELFPRYLGAERSEYTEAVTRLLFNGAIQRVMNPGIKFDLCIILADTKQGTGKSSVCRFLAIRDEWFCDALGDLSDTKKAYEAIRGHWICELGEMIATRRTKDIESIKAYLSRTADDYRDPYGVYPERRPRQCIFIGSTNKPQFLPDDKTGNRRFLPILCDGNKADRHPLDDETETRAFILQCYAEAMAKGREEGFFLMLDQKFDDQLNEIRDLSSPEDSSVGEIQAWLDRTADDLVCTRTIWDGVYRDVRGGEPQRYELQNISDIMNTAITGWERYHGKSGTGSSGRARFGKYGSQRAWTRVSRRPADNVAEGVSAEIPEEFIPVEDVDQLELPIDFRGA